MKVGRVAAPRGTATDLFHQDTFCDGRLMGILSQETPASRDAHSFSFRQTDTESMIVQSPNLQLIVAIHRTFC